MTMEVPRQEAAPSIGRRSFLVGTGRLGVAVALGGMAGSGVKLVWDADGSGVKLNQADFVETATQRPRLSFSSKGSGPPLVLLHGAGSSRRMWAPVLDPLARRYHVLTPDLPGFGQSPALWNSAPDVPAVADAVMYWLNKLGLERPHIVGNSFGAGVALELWMRGAARSVTALSPIGFWNGVEHTYARHVIEKGYRLSHQLRPLLPLIAKTEAVTAFLSLFYARPNVLDEEYVFNAIDDMIDSGATLFQTMDATCSFRVPRYETKTPLTIAWGAEDRLLIGPQHQRARDSLSAARHIVLPDCGHVCMADDPAHVVATINETVARSHALG